MALTSSEKTRENRQKHEEVLSKIHSEGVPMKGITALKSSIQGPKHITESCTVNVCQIGE